MFLGSLSEPHFSSWIYFLVFQVLVVDSDGLRDGGFIEPLLAQNCVELA
jgi:hypothetical protein